jgi:sporadic carbohydrate cluster 2OG-Fe(II) oxygenase
MNHKIKFNIKEFDFQEMVLKTLRNQDGLNKIERLEDLHKHVKYWHISKLEKSIYELFLSKNFLEKYDALCSNIITQNLKCKASFQKIPSIRIQFPGQASVNFHTDEWYGHGSEIKNFWLPLVNVHGSASLALLTENISREVLKTLSNTKGLTIDLINKMCEEKATLLKCDYGDIFMFDAKRLHGTTLNEEKFTRVSFDFRMQINSSNTGKKDTSFFVNSGFSKDLGKSAHKTHAKGFDITAFGYVSSFFNVDFNISQKYQQLLCVRYAEENELNLIGMETEISGFKEFLNLEDLISGTRKNTFKNLLVFSEKCLPADKDRHEDLLNSAKSAGIIIHLICEDLVIS